MDENTTIGVKEIPRMNIQWDWKEALRCVNKSKFTDDSVIFHMLAESFFLQFIFTFSFALRNPRGKAWISCKQESKCINRKTFITNFVPLSTVRNPVLNQDIIGNSPKCIIFCLETFKKKKERKNIYHRSVGGTQMN